MGEWDRQNQICQQTPSRNRCDFISHRYCFYPVGFQGLFPDIAPLISSDGNLLKCPGKLIP